MFERVKREEVPEVLDYFAQDRKNCLYSLIDLKKYGIDNPNLVLYVDRDAFGAIRCVLTCYFGGANVFSCKDALDEKETARMLKKLAPSMINAPDTTIRLLRPLLDSEDTHSCYEYEQGYVTEYCKDLGKETDFPEVEEAGEEDLLEIARLICTDEGLGGTYEPESFAAQLLERRRDGFGRNYCIRKEGKIVCHAGTYAAVDDLAVVSGVITAEDFRGQNLAYKVVSKLSRQLTAEGKLPCLFYYTKSAARLYEKVGFALGTPWAKLIRKQG